MPQCTRLTIHVRIPKVCGKADAGPSACNPTVPKLERRREDLPGAWKPASLTNAVAKRPSIKGGRSVSQGCCPLTSMVTPTVSHIQTQIIIISPIYNI